MFESVKVVPDRYLQTRSTHRQGLGLSPVRILSILVFNPSDFFIFSHPTRICLNDGECSVPASHGAASFSLPCRRA